jgi:pimeloyl-ACP methyl ester carboxylesterase
MDRRLWDDQVASVGGAFTVIRFDLRGHGRSDAPPGVYSPSQFADDLNGLIGALGLTRPAVVGHSVGGNAAVTFAIRYPEALGALALVAGGAEGRPPSPRLAAFMERQRRAFEESGVSEEWVEKRVEGLVYADTPQFAAKQERVREMLRAWSGASVAIFSPPPPPERPAPIERLGEIRVPTLVLVGEHDGGIFQSAANTLAEGIRGAEKWVVPAAAHLPMLENPEGFNEALLGFLRRRYASAFE